MFQQLFGLRSRIEQDRNVFLPTVTLGSKLGLTVGAYVAMLTTRP